MAATVGMLVTAAAPSVAKPRTRLALPGSAPAGNRGGGAGLVVESSSRPQKKATAHHMKTRPKKTQPWDIKRKGPTFYPPLPALPPDWTLVTDEQLPQEEEVGAAESSSSSD